MTHVELWRGAGHVELVEPGLSVLPMRPQAAPTTSNPTRSHFSLPIVQGCLWNPPSKGAMIGGTSELATACLGSAGFCKLRPAGEAQSCNSEPAMESEEDALVPCLASLVPSHSSHDPLRQRDRFPSPSGSFFLPTLPSLPLLSTCAETLALQSTAPQHPSWKTEWCSG